MRLKITLVLLSSVFSTLCFSQKKVSVCNDPKLHSELVDINNNLEQRGFKLVEYQSLTMLSGAMMPIYITLEQGKMYQFNFLVNQNYNQYTLTLIDQNKTVLINEKMKAKDHNYKLSKSFSAPYSGRYVVALAQKVKGQKEACGEFSVLKAVNDHLPEK